MKYIQNFKGSEVMTYIQMESSMKILKTVVLELEALVCGYCNADTSNCPSCLSRKRIIEILEENNIDTKKYIK